MMPVYFYNTMSRSREEFHALTPGEVRMYTCGPTVYNFAHIGNFRAYVFEDLLHRTLKYHGYKVTQVMNLTDVDDKTIRDSRARNMKLQDFTQIYKNAFFDDIRKLRITPAAFYPAATDHIPDMIALIQALFDRGYAYQADDKSIYFSINKFPAYGKLARIDRDNQMAGVRINTDEYAKDSVADFALWKAWDEKDGDVQWDSPWGKGRPGWHIECSAMSMKYLGKTFDIHTGGIDNMFPHHEDEIAQSEAANGCKYVNYWLHCAHLMVDGEKMSKSAGNFYTIRDLEEKGFSGVEMRWVLIGAHYRKKLNFTLDACEQARVTLKKFREMFIRLKGILTDGTAAPEYAQYIVAAVKQFGEAMADDLNISEALSAVFGLMHETNKKLDAGELNAEEASLALDAFRDFNRILDVFDLEAVENVVPANINALAEQRRDARKNKDWAASDRLRDEIKAQGWLIEDVSGGNWRLKKL